MYFMGFYVISFWKWNEKYSMKKPKPEKRIFLFMVDCHELTRIFGGSRCVWKKVLLKTAIEFPARAPFIM
jgi:hypothetical protein